MMPAAAPSKYEPMHGTEARYQRGCRCGKCKVARAKRVRERKEAKALAEAVPVTPIDAAPSLSTAISGVEGAVRLLTKLIADDPQTQVRAQIALALARRLDAGDGAPAPISAQLDGLLVTLKPVKASGVVADGVAAARLTALRGSRGRLDPRGVPGSAGAAAVGDEA